MKIDLKVESPVSDSVRIQQLGAMFDLPPSVKSRRAWGGDVPIEDEPWSVGLIVGPSGAGKSQVAQSMFPGLVDTRKDWGSPSVIDDFREGLSMADISNACQSVGFNTIPAWTRPFSVLSNGEKFRVDLARRLLESPSTDPIVVDEFTSVVDRQVAKIGSHAVQKYARRTGKQFVGISCHSDIVDWLQPDWILEPATMTFSRRRLRRRPTMEFEFQHVSRNLWRQFAPFHYMSANLAKTARCFALTIRGEAVAFVGVMHRPYVHKLPLYGISRVVTMPDWQGLGLGMVIMEAVGSFLRSLKIRMNIYPAHPSFIQSCVRSKMWRLSRKGTDGSGGANRNGKFAGTPGATFQYAGPAMPESEAKTVAANFSEDRTRLGLEARRLLKKVEADHE